MPLPSVTVGYIVFLVTNQFPALIGVLWEYIPKSILSVRLYHDLQTNSGALFLY